MQGKPLQLTLILLLLMLAAIVSHASAHNAPTMWPTRDHDYARTGSFQGIPRGYTVNGYNLLWKFEAGLCVASSPVVGDFNGDGIIDVSFASCDEYQYTVYGTNGTLEWKVKTGGGLVSPSAGDVNGDGKPEIIVGGASHLLYCFTGDGRILWIVKQGYFERALPVVGDFNGDGRVEVAANSLDGRVFIVDGPTGRVEWSGRVGAEAVSPLASADVNGDGLPDIVGTSGNILFTITYSGGNYTVHELELPGDAKGFPALYDVNGDGLPEMLVAYGDSLSAVSYTKGVLWTAPLPGEMENSVAVGDVLHTGTPQIVATTSDGIFIYSLNGTLLEEITGFNGAYASPLIGDLTGDGLPDLLVAGYNGRVYILNVSAGDNFYQDIVYEFDTHGPIMSSPTVADVNGDGIPEILIPSRDFNLYAYTPNATITHTATPMPTQTSTTSGQSATTSRARLGPANGGPGWSSGTLPASGTGRLNPKIVGIVTVIVGAMLAAAILYSRRI